MYFNSFFFVERCLAIFYDVVALNRALHLNKSIVNSNDATIFLICIEEIAFSYKSSLPTT